MRQYSINISQNWNNPLPFLKLSYGWWRWGSIVFLGIIARLVIDMVFALMYKNYVLFSWRSLLNYFLTIAFAFVIVEGIRFINRVLNDYYPWEVSPFRRFVIQGVTNIVYFLFVNNGLRIAFLIVFFPNKAIMLWEQVVINVVVIALLIIVELVDLGIFLLNHWRKSLTELEHFKRESIEFQLATLKSQVNPHFLFNSLNTLSSLIFQNQEQAAQFVQRLSKVYRYVLENREREVVVLSEEMRFLEDYISLLAIRFGASLAFYIDIPRKFRTQFIAPMTIQMLVENAIKHNVKSKRKPLSIHIRMEGNKVEVSNNLQLKKRIGYSSGIGLKNIQSRYAFLTDEKVEVLHNEQQFSVRLPLLAFAEEG
ncbi:MAG: sensor histidine kinase [Flammeovirgaceae bacterium]